MIYLIDFIYKYLSLNKIEINDNKKKYFYKLPVIFLYKEMHTIASNAA